MKEQKTALPATLCVLAAMLLLAGVFIFTSGFEREPAATTTQTTTAQTTLVQEQLTEFESQNQTTSQPTPVTSQTADTAANVTTDTISAVPSTAEQVTAFPATSQEQTTQQQIGAESAKQKALAHAGVSENDAVFIKVEFDFDVPFSKYDIEFIAGGNQYEYEISAISGAVLDWSKQSDSSAATQNENYGYIGVAKAKEIALNDAGCNQSDVFFTEASLDADDGLVIYNVEFRRGVYEYEYEIDALSGAVVQKEVSVF